MVRVVWLLFVQPPPTVAGRPYHDVTLQQMATTPTRWTHVETCGTVVYRRRMRDGDWHMTLDNGTGKVVAEIIPAIPLDPPSKGRRVRVRGISRWDRAHGWAEVHPVETWWYVDRC